MTRLGIYIYMFSVYYVFSVRNINIIIHVCVLAPISVVDVINWNFPKKKTNKKKILRAVNRTGRGTRISEPHTCVHIFRFLYASYISICNCDL